MIDDTPEATRDDVSADIPACENRAGAYYIVVSKMHLFVGVYDGAYVCNCIDTRQLDGRAEKQGK